MFRSIRALRAKIRDLVTVPVGASLADAFSTVPEEDPANHAVHVEKPHGEDPMADFPELTDEEPPDLSWMDTPFKQSHRDSVDQEYVEVDWVLGDLMEVGVVSLWSGHPEEDGEILLDINSEEDLEGARKIMRRGIGTFWVTPDTEGRPFFVYP